jgi:MFS family permease
MSASGTIGTAINETRGSLATVFRNRSLRRLNLALAGSMIGDWAYYTALVIWAYGVGGATAVGIFGTIKMAASAVAAPFTSALADRMSRRRLMVVCDVVRAVLVTAAAALVQWGGPDLAVFSIAVVAGLVGTAFRPAQLALTPSLVDQPDELTAANGVGSTIESLAFFVGPAIAGLLLGVTDVATVFLLNAATFVWSAVLVAGVHPHRGESAGNRSDGTDRGGEQDRDPEGAVGGDQDGGFVRTALAGFGVIWRHPDLRLITGIYAAQTVVAGASLVFGVAIALDLTDLGPSGLGYLDSTLGVGALVGGLLTVALASRHRLASDFGWGVFFWAVPLLLIAVWPVAAAAFVAMAVIGAANPVVDVNANTILQRLAPDAVLGRVFGALESALIATMALGSLVMPLLIAWVGLQWGLVVLSVPIAAVALAALPRLRRLDASVSEPEGVALLYGVPLFQPLRRPMVEKLAATLEQRRVTAGDLVVREGDVGDLFYVIESGALDATHDGRLLTHMEAGDHFGEIALLRDVPRTASVVATEDSVLQTIQREDFLAALTGDEELRGRTESVAARRLANT